MARKEREVWTQTVLDSANATTIPILFSTATVYSKTFRVDDAFVANVSAVLGLVAATGTANAITVTVEQSYEPPNVEGSAHPSFITTDTVMNTFGTVGTHTHAAVTINGMKYARLKVVTSASLNTSSYVAAVFSKQVEG